MHGQTHIKFLQDLNQMSLYYCQMENVNERGNESSYPEKDMTSPILVE